jgi:predicted ATPase/DNA-binding SARP family transcriptional activator
MGAVQFRVLGPLEATGDGRQLRLGGRRSRAVLAALLLECGRHVRTDALVEAVWGEGAPATAVKGVQKYVSFLRRQLDAPELIVSRPGGYGIATDAVDCRRFERLVDEAEGVGAAEEVAARLTEALALWRGEPYPDLGDLPTARAERRRLEERRLAAVEALVDARLALGQHHGLVGWLEQLVAAHPLHERLWGQLMVALYRSGRQADALAAFRRLRGTLVEQLGVEPAPELQRLHEQVLGQHHELEPAGSRAYGVAAGDAGNLPRQLTSFVGRATEFADLAALTDAHRAVTLTGAAGAGKTRLALEVAERVRGRYRDGAWLVELATLGAPEQVPLAAAGALGLGEQPGRAMIEVLADHLHRRRLLLVLDNAEHLPDGAADLVDRLLRRAPELHVLATSRQPLGVEGEVTYDVPPLPVPPADTDTEAGIDAYDAVRLLTDRARAADPRVTVATGTAGSLARICRRLDGLPLALELAAARLRTFDPQRLAGLLDDRFSVLESTTRRAPARHQTLRAAIGWSYDLLTAEEQALFRRLSVFDGGFTLEAAEQVCTSAPLHLGTILTGLPSLVDRSLVVADRHPDGGTRYRLLETLREYARERLAADEAAELHGRHLRFFLDLAEQAARELRSPRQRQWLAVLAGERDNLRAALRWSLTREEGAHQHGVRLATLMWRYWEPRAQFSEARAWVDTALPVSAHAGPRARAELLATSAAVALSGSAHEEATAPAGESLELFQTLGSEPGMAQATSLLGVAALYRGDHARAGELLERSRAEFARLDQPWDQASVLGRLGCLMRLRGDYGGSRAHFEEAAALHRGVGDERGVAWTTWQLGVLACHQEDYPRAARLCQESLGLYQRLGASYGLAHVQYTLGDLAAVRGDDGEAARLYEVSLSALRDLGDRQCMASTLSSLAAVALRASQPERAAELLTESMTLHRELGDQAGVAGCLERFAEVRQAAGDLAPAVWLLGAAEALREASGAVRPAADEAAHAVLVGTLREALSEPAFAAAWDAGRATPHEAQLTRAAAAPWLG